MSQRHGFSTTTRSGPPTTPARRAPTTSSRVIRRPAAAKARAKARVDRRPAGADDGDDGFANDKVDDYEADDHNGADDHDNGASVPQRRRTQDHDGAANDDRANARPDWMGGRWSNQALSVLGRTMRLGQPAMGTSSVFVGPSGGVWLKIGAIDRNIDA